MERDETESQEVTTPPDETSTETQEKPVNQSPPQDSHPSIDTSGRAIYLSVIQDKNREIEQLRQQVAEKSKPQDRPITQEQESKFFEQPITNTKQLIQSELEKQLQPLHNFIQGFQRTTQYDILKRNVRTQNPLLGNLLTPDIEPYVDQYMQGADPTDANLTAAILQVKGAQAAGLLTPTQAPQNNTQPYSGPVNNPPVPQNNNPPQNNQNMTTPAHLRPSAPAAPKEKSEVAKKPLTENERLLMRQWGMSEEEYRNGQDLKVDGRGEANNALIMEPDTKPKKKEEK